MSKARLIIIAVVVEGRSRVGDRERITDGGRVYKKETLPADRATDLDEVPGWEWDPHKARFNRNLAALRQYISREGDVLVPQSHAEAFGGEDINLGAWVSRCRQARKKARLSDEKVQALKAVPGWDW